MQIAGEAQEVIAVDKALPVPVLPIWADMKMTCIPKFQDGWTMVRG